LIVIQAAALMLVFQVLLAYAVLRVVAAGAVPAAVAADPFAVRPASRTGRAQALHRAAAGRLCACSWRCFWWCPCWPTCRASLRWRSASGPWCAKSPGGGRAAGAFVAVGVRQHPQRPGGRGTPCWPFSQGHAGSFLERKNDWVNIGANRWIPEKFLSPLGTK
jgi:hypothetical protein